MSTRQPAEKNATLLLDTMTQRQQEDKSDVPLVRVGVWPSVDALHDALVDALTRYRGCELVSLPADVDRATWPQPPQGVGELLLVVVDQPQQLEAAVKLCGALPASALMLVPCRQTQREAFELLLDRHDVELRGAPSEVIGARLSVLLRRQRTELQRQQVQQEQQHNLQSRDFLTGLHNRRYCQERWTELQKERTQGSVRVVGALMDLDHFKSINDRYGHSAGDDVISTVGRRLASLRSADDLLVRMGGEEFLWVFFGERASTAPQILEEARAAVARPIETSGGQTLSLTISAGWDHIGIHEDLRQWFERVDKALYAAKSQGRDRLLDFSSLLHGYPDAGELQLKHFQNVAKVVTERTTHLLSTFSEDLVRDARRAADQDALTQVFNKGYFDRRFARELDLARQQATPLSLVVFDLDHFGHFNREHGMPTADAVLQAFCRLAAHCIRASDWIARYGGEEFVLVVRGPLNQARQVAERVRSEFEVLEIVSATGQCVHATVSAGVVDCGSVPGNNPAEIVEAASKCLQQAKRLGRNRVQCRDSA